MPLLLVADGLTKSPWAQAALGVLTFGVLWLCARQLPSGQRSQLWICVAVATGFEIVGSLIWGVYRYRLLNVPLYVPPGHGLVYFFGLTAAALPLFQRRGRLVAGVALVICTAWALAGLTLLPSLTGRIDVHGAICWPIFAWCILRSPRYAMYAGIFLITSELELVGVNVGDWTWQAVAPWDHLSTGNPPSAVAGGYSVIDGSVALALLVLQRLGLLRPVKAPASALDSAA